MDAEGTFRRIDHVGVVVRDIELTRAAYVRDFGLEPDGEEVVDSVNVRLAYLKCLGDRDPAYLQLVQPLGPGPAADFLAEHGEGLHHVCFGVPDISRALRQIDGEADTAVFQGGRGRAACFLGTRPDNVLIEPALALGDFPSVPAPVLFKTARLRLSSCKRAAGRAVTSVPRAAWGHFPDDMVTGCTNEKFP
jgi:catechol 2,3-dioxygenase-like lactoylglutathione lyase family enzyme